jgi:K+-transporting ATPase c subunit
MLTQILPALRAMILFTVVTGLVYPGIVTGLCQLLFRDKANGSLVRIGGQVVGSSLLGRTSVGPSTFIRALPRPERLVTTRPLPEVQTWDPPTRSYMIA